MSTALTPKEKSRYAFCKKEIQTGMETVFEVGDRLREVRDQHLYREEYRSFADFCAGVHQLGKTHAYRLIDAVKTRESVSPMGDKLTTERAARELETVPVESRKAVLKAADQKPGGATARNIAETKIAFMRNGATPKSGKPPVELDDGRLPLTKENEPFWRRRQEIQDLMTAIVRVRSTIQKAFQDGDMFLGWIHNQIDADLGLVYSKISDAKPYTACLRCQGFCKATKCAHCHGTGFYSKKKFDAELPELKKQRAHRIKELGYDTAPVPS